MKLASLKQGRDGALVVVSRDLRRCVRAEPIAPTMQHALDHWAEAAPTAECGWSPVELPVCKAETIEFLTSLTECSVD